MTRKIKKSTMLFKCILIILIRNLMESIFRLTDLGSMVENNKGIASFLSLAMATNALNASIMAVTKK